MRGKRSSPLVFRQRGFTLVELLLVIAILGILATLGFKAFNENRKQAADAQAISFTRNVMTYVVVDEPVAEQDSSENRATLSQAGFPEVDVQGNIEFIIANGADDMWQFWFAHPGGKTGYYFWTPGDLCSRTDDNGDGTGAPSDTIETDPGYRAPLGL